RDLDILFPTVHVGRHRARGNSNCECEHTSKHGDLLSISCSSAARLRHGRRDALTAPDRSAKHDPDLRCTLAKLLLDLVGETRAGECFQRAKRRAVVDY